MSRYIDADALVTDISFFDGDKYHYGYSQGMIESAPTVDAVPVVRCAECKNWLECLIRTDNDGERYSRCCLNGIAVGESFYCADGERRSDGEQ